MESNKRDTAQRRLIKSIIKSVDRPLSPAEILEQAQKEIPSLGLATVYRNVKALSEEGVIAPVELPGEGQRFEMAGKHHHHHFHCKSCGKVFEMEGCCLENDVKDAPDGFSVDEHMVVYYGRCAGCNGLQGSEDVSQCVHSHGTEH